jgi:hypothetical protein
MTLVLEEYFNCSICLKIYDNPFTINCGHTFCKNCLKRLSKSICPICRKPFKETNSNISMKKVIDDIQTFKQKEIQDKFFPCIKEQELRERKKLKLFMEKIYGKDFLCEYDYCNEYIKCITVDYLLYPNEILDKCQQSKIK